MLESYFMIKSFLFAPEGASECCWPGRKRRTEKAISCNEACTTEEGGRAYLEIHKILENSEDGFAQLPGPVCE